ncbi:MAG TPA: hypothetical protein V6C65_31150 [Allocoleopsis sp.]
MKKGRARRGTKKIKKRCSVCGKPPLAATAEKKSPLCFMCYLKNAARVNLGSRKRWRELQRLLDTQRWKCPYTQVKLVLGKNASLDHKLPKSRYPDQRYAIQNLEWVEQRINTMKNNMTKQEFLELLSLICENQQ